jgi:hypothetical protein
MALNRPPEAEETVIQHLTNRLEKAWNYCTQSGKSLSEEMIIFFQDQKRWLESLLRRMNTIQIVKGWIGLTTVWIVEHLDQLDLKG